MDYGKIIKRSWELTWRNKWLWVYGLVVAVLGGVGFSNFGNGFSNFARDARNPELKLPENLPRQTSEVLGQATNAIVEWFKSVPVGTWILLGLGILVLIIIGIAVRWVMLSWAKGGLIAGLWEADKDQKVTLSSTSKEGIKSIKSLIWLGIINFLMVWGVAVGFVVAGGLGFLGFSFLPSPVKGILMVLWGLAMLLTFVTTVFLLAMVSIWAERLIVLENYPAWKAWKMGFSLSWKHFWSVIVMGIVNVAVGCGVGCLSMIVTLIVLGIPAALIAVPLFKNGWDRICWWSVAALAVLFFLFVYLSLLVRIVLTVFNYGNWNLFYKQVASQKDKS